MAVVSPSAGRRPVSSSTVVLAVSAMAVGLMLLGVDTRAWTRDLHEALDWRVPLAEAEAALAAGDVAGAVLPWHEARRRALTGRRWEGLVEVGTLYRRLGAAGGFAGDATITARALYSRAMTHARAERSLEGVLRVGDGFADLGDRDVVAACLDEARGLAGADAAARARVLEAAGRWDPDHRRARAR